MRDVIFVALFAEEELAVHGKVLLGGFVADERVEVRLVVAGFWAQDAAHPLGFLLA